MQQEVLYPSIPSSIWPFQTTILLAADLPMSTENGEGKERHKAPSNGNADGSQKQAGTACVIFFGGSATFWVIFDILWVVLSGSTSF